MSAKIFFRKFITFLIVSFCFSSLCSVASASSIIVTDGNIQRRGDYGDDKSPTAFSYTDYYFTNDPHGTINKSTRVGYVYTGGCLHGRSNNAYQGSYILYGNGSLRDYWDTMITTSSYSSYYEIIWLNDHQFCFGDLSNIYDTNNRVIWAYKLPQRVTYQCYHCKGETATYRVADVLVYAPLYHTTTSINGTTSIDLSYPHSFNTVTLRNLSVIPSTSYGQTNCVTLNAYNISLTLENVNLIAKTTSTYQYARDAIVTLTARAPTKFTATSSTFGELNLGTGSGGGIYV